MVIVNGPKTSYAGAAEIEYYIVNEEGVGGEYTPGPTGLHGFSKKVKPV